MVHNDQKQSLVQRIFHTFFSYKTVDSQQCLFTVQGLRGAVMEHHLEESSQQHLVLMCGLATRQQHQITSLKSALSRLSLNHTGQ